MRRSVKFGLSAGLFGWLWVSQALADHCHRPPLEPRRARHSAEPRAAVRVEGRSVFATFETRRYRGSYEGLGLAGGWSNQRWRAEADLPVYRLVKNGKSEHGPGDALLALAITTWTTEAFRAGFEAGGTVPFGEAEAELGMGHVMLLPSAWGSLELGDTRVAARLGYAAALAEASGHHAHGMSPLVGPMNHREVGAALFVNGTLRPGIGVQLGADLALPTGDGQTRSIVSGAILFDAGRLTSLVELELPLVGNPFTVRASTALGARW